MLETSKLCGKCKIIKLISEFNKRCDSKDGYRNYCKPCMANSNKEYRINNLSKIQSQKKEMYLKNKDDILIKRKIYNDENKDKISERKKLYYLENIEKFKIKNAKYRSDNIIRLKKKDIEYYNSNKSTRKEYLKIYRSSVHGKMVINNLSNKRRSLKRKTYDGTVPLDSVYPLTAELEQLLMYQNYKCNNCGCDITKEKHLDHHIPLSKGGQHSICNVVWLCPKCNLIKGANMPDSKLHIGF